MKKLLLATLLIPTMLIAQEMSEDNKHMFCGDGRVIMESLKQQHQEIPVILAVGDDANIVITVNLEKGNWTALETHGQRTMCILGSGSNFKVGDKLAKNISKQ